MLKEKLEKALNEQLNFELYSAYIYMSMSSYFSSKNLNGFASWMRVQTQEELVHAAKFYEYIIERGGRAILEAIDKPETEWGSPIQPFKDAYEHETKVTARINNIMDLAMEEKDHATASMLKWFIDEQVEEENSVDEIVKQLELVNESPQALLMLDKELAQRSFAVPGGINIPWLAGTGGA